MKRRTDFTVGRDREFTWDQWQYLDKAFQCFPHRASYRVSPFGLPTGTRTFFVSRADHKCLVNAEIEALSWFFQGVVASPGFPNAEA